MDRMEQLNEIARICLKQRYRDRMEGIKGYYSVHKDEIWEQYEDKIKEGAEECERQGRKVEYVIISMLDSSLLTKSFEMQIAFYDEHTYLDETPICQYWSPGFLFDSVENDMSYLRGKASSKIIKLRDYETDGIMKKYVMNYYYHAFLIIREMTPEILERLSTNYDCMSGNIQVLFGKYMDNPMIIYQKKESKA